MARNCGLEAAPRRTSSSETVRVVTLGAAPPRAVLIVAPISGIETAGPFESRNRWPAAPAADIAETWALATSRTSTIGMYTFGRAGMAPVRIDWTMWLAPE